MGDRERWRYLTYIKEPISSTIHTAATDGRTPLRPDVTELGTFFMESYYFHVYVVCCDVHFRYSDDAFMWTE